jgi:hypothetical protein
MGRPTIDGYWWSGKFYRSSGQMGVLLWCACDGEGTYLARVACLEEAGAAVEDWLSRQQGRGQGSKDFAYQWELRPSCLKLREGGKILSVGVGKLTVGGTQRT